MSDAESSQLPDVLRHFPLPGQCEQLVHLQTGHINTTYVSTWKTAGGLKRYVHQKINHHIFQDVPGLMHNISRVTDHLRAELARTPHPHDTTLTIINTLDGRSYAECGGEFWRTFDYIENSKIYNSCPRPHIAAEAASAVGRFTRYISTMKTGGLIETIPHFLDTTRRFTAFHEAMKNDVKGRLADVQREIDFALQREKFGATLMDALHGGQIPCRVSHNDTKINNVLFREQDEIAFCLVDLDTCMPGTPLYDFGDFARNTSVAAAEDERDLTKVRFDLEMFEAVVRGFVTETKNILTETEFALLAKTPQLLALTLGVRFLSDHLNGDTYFQIHRPGHNLDRARTQFAIVSGMEARGSDMRKIVERFAK